VGCGCWSVPSPCRGSVGDGPPVVSCRSATGRAVWRARRRCGDGRGRRGWRRAAVEGWVAGVSGVLGVLRGWGYARDRELRGPDGLLWTLGRPVETVRGWLRRFAGRAEAVLARSPAAVPQSHLPEPVVASRQAARSVSPSASVGHHILLGMDGDPRSSEQAPNVRYCRCEHAGASAGRADRLVRGTPRGVPPLRRDSAQPIVPAATPTPHGHPTYCSWRAHSETHQL
jgi:hypothetical protein